MNENHKCHLHIPQLKKGIFVLSIIIQSILQKRKCEGKGPQKNIQNPITPLIGIQKPDGSKCPEDNQARNQATHL